MVKMASEYVFIFVAAGNCPSCQRFKGNLWKKTRQELEKISSLRIVEVEVPKIGDPLPPSYPLDLKNYVQWFPTFLLTTQKSWSEGLQKGKLSQIAVFNGVVNQDRCTLVPINQRQPIEEAVIVDWVKKEINNFKAGTGPSLGSLYHKNLPKTSSSKSTENSSQGTNKYDEEIYTPTYCQRAFIPAN